MKPKTKRAESTSVQIEAAKTDQVPTRTIYVRDDEQTRVGFSSQLEASDHADTLVKADRNGSRDSEKMRVRVAFRNRTGLYDVVVKTMKRVVA